jgi:hypothetical protein
MVTAWRKREVTVEVTRALGGPGSDAADWALDVRRCSIVKVGFKRQKLIDGV